VSEPVWPSGTKDTDTGAVLAVDLSGVHEHRSNLGPSDPSILNVLVATRYCRN